jgi:hypothetical protein
VGGIPTVTLAKSCRSYKCKSPSLNVSEYLCDPSKISAVQHHGTSEVSHHDFCDRLHDLHGGIGKLLQKVMLKQPIRLAQCPRTFSVSRKFKVTTLPACLPRRKGLHHVEQKIWTTLCSGAWHHVVWRKCTNVSCMSAHITLPPGISPIAVGK